MSGPWEKFQAAQPTGNEGPWNKFAQAPTKDDEPGFLGQIDNAMRQVANGITFGYADKLAAAMNGGSYEDNIKREREQSKKAEHDLGMAALPLDIAGGVMGALATGGGSLVGRGATMAGKIGYGALEGAGYGALNAAGHTDDGNYTKSLPEGAAVGAALGGALPIATKAIGKAVSPLAEKMSDFADQQVKSRALAEQLDIPMTAGMKTGSENLRRAESVASQIPFGNLTGGGMEESLSKFREAVAKRFGMTGDDFSPEMLNRAYQGMQGEYQAITGRNTLRDTNNGFVTDLMNIMDDAAANLKPDQAKFIQDQASNLYKQFVTEHGGALPGESYQKIREQLRISADRYKDSGEGDYFKKIKKAYDDMMGRSVSQADEAAWKDLNNRYAHLKLAQQAMGAGDAATGNLSPLRFARAVERENGKDNFTRGKGIYGDLALLGDDLFRGVPDSGTAGRNFMTKLLEGGGLAGGIGGGFAAGLPGFLAGIATPAAMANALNSKPVQKYLGNQFFTKQREDALRDLLQKYGTSGLLAVGY